MFAPGVIEGQEGHLAGRGPGNDDAVTVDGRSGRGVRAFAILGIGLGRVISLPDDAAVAASRQHAIFRPASGSPLVTKTRRPKTTGEEWPTPGSLTFQL